MAILELDDLLVNLFFGVLHRLTDFVPPLVHLVGCGVLVRLLHFFGSVFSVAPSLLGRALGLIRNPLIGQFVVADSFSNRLLYLSNCLLNLARNLILIHCCSPCRRECGLLLRVAAVPLAESNTVVTTLANDNAPADDAAPDEGDACGLSGADRGRSNGVPNSRRRGAGIRPASCIKARSTASKKSSINIKCLPRANPRWADCMPASRQSQNMFSSCAICRVASYSWSSATTNLSARRTLSTESSLPCRRAIRARTNLSRTDWDTSLRATYT